MSCRAYAGTGIVARVAVVACMLTARAALPAAAQEGIPPACAWLVPAASLDAAEQRQRVETLLREPDAAARAAAARALGRASSLDASAMGVNRKGGRHALAIAVHDPAPGVRLAAACALGRHGDARDLVPLERRRADAPADLAEALDWALARIRARTEPPLLLRGGTVVDGTGAAPRPGTSILVEGTVITRVGPDGSFAVPPGARVVDAAGRWITPGLWDMHVHLGHATPAALPLFVAAGITSVRDMGGELAELSALRERTLAGGRPGPDIVLAGPMLEAPATLERMAGMPTGERWRVTRVPVPGPAAAAHIVDSIAALGVDFVKVRETADLETYRAIAAAARARGVPLAGHAPFGMDVTEGARLGLTTFEHASYPYPLDTVPRARAEALRAFREGGTAIVPTMVAWGTNLMHPDSVRLLMADSSGKRDPRRPLLARRLITEWAYDLADAEVKGAEALRGWCGFVNRTLEDLAAMHAAGVAILPGSDLAGIGLLPGWSLLDELELLVEGGVMSPGAALMAATSQAARHAGRGEEVGTVESGRRADLLLLAADPTRDVGAFRTLGAVVLRGQFLEEERLLALRGGVVLSERDGIELFPGVLAAGCGVLTGR